MLCPASQLGFVLHGGTAVALRYGHRVSIDYDFFGPRSLDKDRLYQHLADVMRDREVLQDAPDTLTVVSHGVKISFFGVGLDPLEPPSLTTDGVALVASAVDLLAEKLKVILQRAEAKDYLDIAAILRHGTDLVAGLKGARRLFGEAFQPAEALRTLTYFEDVRLADRLDQTLRRDLREAARRAMDELSAMPRAGNESTLDMVQEHDPQASPQLRQL